MEKRRWFVKCQVNLCADREVLAIVVANTERKAKSLAMKLFHKQGYFAVTVLCCEPYKKEDENV